VLLIGAPLQMGSAEAAGVACSGSDAGGQQAHRRDGKRDDHAVSDLQTMSESIGLAPAMV
jgi:hypothetical protein